MSTARTSRRKPRVPQPALSAAPPSGAEIGAIGLRATRFRLAGDDYVVLSYARPDIEAPPQLSSTERAVFHALLAGQSNQQIAASRDRAVRTVANQVAAIFAKLSVGSRAELYAKYAGVR